MKRGQVGVHISRGGHCLCKGPEAGGSGTPSLAHRGPVCSVEHRDQRDWLRLEGWPDHPGLGGHAQIVDFILRRTGTH